MAKGVAVAIVVVMNEVESRNHGGGWRWFYRQRGEGMEDDMKQREGWK